MILKTYFNGKKLKHQNSTNCFIWKQNLYELSFNLAKNSNIRSSLSWIFNQKFWPPFQSFLYWEFSITKTYLIITQFLFWEHTLWSSHCCFSKTFLTLNHTEIFVDLFFLLPVSMEWLTDTRTRLKYTKVYLISKYQSGMFIFRRIFKNKYGFLKSILYYYVL